MSPAGLIRFVVALAGLALLAGCAGPAEPKWASDEEVARARYVDDGPPSLTLFTVIDNRNGFGAHAGLMVNAKERVMFDPAGTWYHPRLPERNDVHFGMSDAAVDFYVDYHSRITYRTVIQEIEVSPEVAQMAMDEVLAYGAVPKAQCTVAISSILRKLPGFETVPQTWFPRQVTNAFAKMPGVKTRVVRDDDPDDNDGFIVAYGI